MALTPVAASPAISSAVASNRDRLAVDRSLEAQLTRLLDDGARSELGLRCDMEGVRTGVE